MTPEYSPRAYQCKYNILKDLPLGTVILVQSTHSSFTSTSQSNLERLLFSLQELWRFWLRKTYQLPKCTWPQCTHMVFLSLSPFRVHACVQNAIYLPLLTSCNHLSPIPIYYCHIWQVHSKYCKIQIFYIPTHNVDMRAVILSFKFSLSPQAPKRELYLFCILLN